MSMLQPIRNKYGITLVELMVTLAILSTMTAFVLPYTISQNNRYKTETLRTDMQQDVRAAMDFMLREIRRAGFDPARKGFDGVLYNTDTLVVRADLNADGDLEDTYEVIGYSLDTIRHRIMRTTPEGSETLIENMQSFVFSYKDSAGTAITSAARQADIRQIELSITGRTGRPDKVYKGNNGYKTSTLATLVVPRNLAL